MAEQVKDGGNTETKFNGSRNTEDVVKQDHVDLRVYDLPIRHYDKIRNRLLDLLNGHDLDVRHHKPEEVS